MVKISFIPLTGVVDSAIVVGVGGAQDVNELFSVLTVAEAILKFIEADHAVTVAIQSLEDALKLSNVFGAGLHGDGGQSHLLNLFGFTELFDISNVEFLDSSASGRVALMGMRTHPAVLQGLGGGKPALGSRDQLINQVLGVSADAIPLFSIEVEVSPRNHLEDLLIVVSVEGRVAAQEDVEHAASRPHVATDVVVSGKHLR